MQIMPRSLNEVPEHGTWAPYQLGRERTALVACPDCGCVGTLEHHSIGADGSVSPTVVCANVDCETDAAIQLQGWKPN